MDDNFKVYEFYKQMQVESVILSFRGAVSQDLLSRLADSLKYKGVTGDSAIGRRVFAIFIELSQNVHLHSAEKSYSVKEDRPIGIGFLLVSETDNYYMVSSSNIVVTEETKPVMERCAYINSLNEKELKEYYKEQRRQPPRKDKPGANIGLIDMVRRSKNPLEVSLYELDDERSVFNLSVKLDKVKR